MTDERDPRTEEVVHEHEPEAPATTTRRLQVTRPVYCTSVTFPEAEGGTLAVTREGTDVPAGLADSLIETAAQSGVTITEVSDQ